jgi:hypothetical protein
MRKDEVSWTTTSRLSKSAFRNRGTGDVVWTSVHTKCYAWYCHAIRANYRFLDPTTLRQKDLRQKNEALGICTPLCQMTIFLPSILLPVLGLHF